MDRAPCNILSSASGPAARLANANTCAASVSTAAMVSPFAKRAFARSPAAPAGGVDAARGVVAAGGADAAGDGLGAGVVVLGAARGGGVVDGCALELLSNSAAAARSTVATSAGSNSLLRVSEEVLVERSFVERSFVTLGAGGTRFAGPSASPVSNLPAT